MIDSTAIGIVQTGLQVLADHPGSTLTGTIATILGALFAFLSRRKK